MKDLKQVIIRFVAVVSCFMVFLHAGQALAGNPIFFIENLDIELNESFEAQQVASAYQALEEGNLGRFISLVNKKATFIIHGDPELIPFAGEFQGKQGAAEYLLALFFNAGITNIQQRFYLQEHNKLLVHVLEEGYSKETGKNYSMETIHEWQVNESGEITLFRNYANTFDLYQAFSPEDVAADLTFRHYMPEDIITPTEQVTYDPGTVVDLFWQYYVAGDLPGLIGIVAPDATLTLEGVSEVVPFAGTYQGIDEIVAFAMVAFSNLQHLQLDITPVYVRDGNRVCTQFFEETVALPTGNVFSFWAIHTFTVNENGKIQTWRSYNNTYNVYKGFLDN